MVKSSHIPSSDDRSKSLVGFTVGEVHYAADILRVREILNPDKVVPIPNTPPSIVGVVEHRGEVIPIMDLRLRFGIPDGAVRPATKWVVVRSKDRHLALAVDSVTEVFGTNKAGGWNSAMPELGDQNRGIAAVFRKANTLVFVIDVETVVQPAQELDLSGQSAIGATNA